MRSAGGGEEEFFGNNNSDAGVALETHVYGSPGARDYTALFISVF